MDRNSGSNQPQIYLFDSKLLSQNETKEQKNSEINEAKMLKELIKEFFMLNQ